MKGEGQIESNGKKKKKRTWLWYCL